MVGGGERAGRVERADAAAEFADTSLTWSGRGLQLSYTSAASSNEALADEVTRIATVSPLATMLSPAAAISARTASPRSAMPGIGVNAFTIGPPSSSNCCWSARKLDCAQW